jgi:hypothetical protein
MRNTSVPAFDEEAILALQEIGFEIKTALTPDHITRMSAPGIEVYTQMSLSKYRVSAAWDYSERYRCVTDAEDLVEVIRLVREAGAKVDDNVRSLCREIEALFKEKNIPYLLNNVHRCKYEFYTRGTSSVLLFGLTGVVDNWDDQQITMNAWEHEGEVVGELTDVIRVWKNWGAFKNSPSRAYTDKVETLAPIESYISEMLWRGVKDVKMEEFTIDWTTTHDVARPLVQAIDRKEDRRRLYTIIFGE